MGILWNTLSSYNSDTMDHVLALVKIKAPNADRHEKEELLLKKLYKTTKIDPFLGEEALERACLKMTAETIDLKGLDREQNSKEDIIDVIYFHYLERIENKIADLKPDERAKLMENLQDEIKKRGMKTIKGGVSMFSTLMAGEAAGFSLFTSSAVALKSLGLLIGVNFGFGVYSGVMAALGVIFGPVGWAIALSIFGIGGWKLIIHRKELQASTIILTLILDYKIQQEMAVQEAYINRFEHLVDELEEQLNLLDDIQLFVNQLDTPIQKVTDELWFQNVMQALPEGGNRDVK